MAAMAVAAEAHVACAYRRLLEAREWSIGCSGMTAGGEP